ncbi:MAG: regulatory iron-sulfur-containing complex subunit RicT [Dehalococcoidia bacterium]
MVATTASSGTSVGGGVAGIRFVEAGPISYCSTGALNVAAGDYVVVRTDRGERLGWVVLGPDQVLGANLDRPMRVIDRLASADDVDAYREQQRRAAEDIARVQSIATRRDPRVRVVSLAYDLAGKHSDIAFVSREQDEGEWLRREAGRQLGADVHVEHVGDRDRAKALGGVGQCGRALCCASWQVEFPAISIKMAKDQGLAPNPSKISGVCGRLLCCLSFELEAYREIMGTLPKVGKRISTPVGRAKVISINALTEVVRIRVDETGEVVEMTAAALRDQYGTAVRPADLEDALERPLHEQDRDRRDNLLAVLEPVPAPTAPRRPRPAQDEEPGERPPRTRARRERGPADVTSTRPARQGVAGRRPARPAGGTAEAAAGEARPPRLPRAPRPPSASAEGAEGIAGAEQARAARPPRPEGASEAGDLGPDGAPRRRRRRGRRGGRGRGGEGGSEGAPATE